MVQICVGVTIVHLVDHVGGHRMSLMAVEGARTHVG